MAGVKKKTNAKTASRLGNNNSPIIKWVLVSFGRPFYLILLVLFIAFFYGISVIGYSVRIAVTKSSARLTLYCKNIKRILLQKSAWKAKTKISTPHFPKRLNNFLYRNRVSFFDYRNRFSNRISSSAQKLSTFLLALTKLVHHLAADKNPKPKVKPRQKTKSIFYTFARTLTKVRLYFPKIKLPKFSTPRLSIRIFGVVALIFAVSCFAFWDLILKDSPISRRSYYQEN